MKNKLEKLVQTGVIVLPILGGCNSSEDPMISDVVISPESPLSEDNLDCVAMELQYVGDSTQYMEIESRSVLDFHWEIDGKEVYSEQGRGWSTLDSSYTQSGDRVLCSAWIPLSVDSESYEAAWNSVYVE